MTTRPTRPCDRGRAALRSSAPSRASQIRIVVSLEEDAIWRPSGDSAHAADRALVPVQDHELRACGRVPHADGPIGGDRGDSPAVRRPGGLLGVIFVTPQREQFPAISGVPDLGRAVIELVVTRSPAGDQATPQPASSVAAQDDQLPSGRGIPDPGGLVD